MEGGDSGFLNIHQSKSSPRHSDHLQSCVMEKFLSTDSVVCPALQHNFIAIIGPHTAFFSRPPPSAPSFAPKQPRPQGPPGRSSTIPCFFFFFVCTKERCQGAPKQPAEPPSVTPQPPSVTLQLQLAAAQPPSVVAGI
uniref:Uncharacterized protein n=1 Tax=Eutreptiella gymnastica TaxID=73025 RepID=A0A7S4FWP8_9EUGL